MTRFWPLKKGTYTISSRFAGRTNPVTGRAENHSGTDFAAKDGTPFYACAGGTVQYIGPASGYGQWIVIDHPASEGGGCSEYGHMWNSFATGLKPGDRVKAGQLLGYVGSNGQSTGPHLHLTVWEYGHGGRRIDPETWLRDAAWPGQSESEPSPKTPKESTVKVLDWHDRFHFGQHRPTSEIKTICIHVTVNAPGTPAENVANYQIRSESGSYHELVDTRPVVLIENTPDWMTWSAGPTANWRGLHRSFVMRGTETAAQWLAQEEMLRAGAERDAAWATRFGIPVRKITAAQLRAGEKGFCGHHDASLAWGESDHVDPGPGFPWDHYLNLVRQYQAGGPAPEGDLTVSEADRVIDFIRNYVGPIGSDTKDNRAQLTGARDNVPGDLAKSYPGWDLARLLASAREKQFTGLTLVEMCAVAIGGTDDDHAAARAAANPKEK